MKKICTLLMILLIGITNIYAQTQIWTADDLNSIRGDLEGEYIQMADIDLSGYSSGLGWKPIGSSDGNFMGLYDGNNFTISNLYINRPLDEDAQGLFGIVNQGTLLNVKLVNINVIANKYVGGLAGLAGYSFVMGCSAEGLVTGNDKVGGLIGWNMDSTTKCNYFCGTVNGHSDVGGLVGWNNYSSVEFSYATGNLSSDGYFVGGLVGRNGYAVIRNCYAIVDVSGSNRVGGLVGYNYYYGIIGKAYSAGEVTSSGISVGGLIGEQMGATTDSCYWDITASGQTTSAAGEGRTTEEMTSPHAANTYTGWNFYGTWRGDTSYNINEGYPYLLSTVAIDTPPQISHDHIAAYPNPFKESASIDFMIDQSSTGDLSVYNIRGQKVRTLYDGQIEGKVTSHYTWDGRDSAGKKVGSGVYMIILKTQETQIHKKILLTK